MRFFPRFIPLARKLLDAQDLYAVRIATVTNFPLGGDDIDIAVKETRAAVAYGADEVDVVLPYQALMQGDQTLALQLIQACKAECGNHAQLKVIFGNRRTQKRPNLSRSQAALPFKAVRISLKPLRGKFR